MWQIIMEDKQCHCKEAGSSDEGDVCLDEACEHVLLLKCEMVNAGIQASMESSEACTQTKSEADACTDHQAIFLSKQSDETRIIRAQTNVTGSPNIHEPTETCPERISPGHAVLYHRAVQTEWYGRDMYHKTTQYPEIQYTPEVENRSDIVTVVSPKVPRGTQQFTSGYKCAEVRSASGVIYGFCPKIIGPVDSEPPCTATSDNIHSAVIPHVLEISSSTESATLSVSEIKTVGSAAVTTVTVSSARGTLPGLTVPPPALPALYTSAVFPYNYQFPVSFCVPFNPMVPYPHRPQASAMTMGAPLTSPGRACSTAMYERQTH